MPTSAEQNAVAAGRGKWARADVPHTGWQCVRIEDRGRPIDICGMCESQPIRYVHFMQHPMYPGELAVGCICAGYMEEDLEAARTRDREMVRRAGKRRRWISRHWNVSPNNNEWIESDGYRVTVYRLRDTWAATVSALHSPFKRESKLRYDSADEVKLAAFDVITHRLSRGR